MISVQLAKNASPQQIEVEGEITRTVKGAIHFRPGRIVSLSKAEFDFVKKNHPQLAKKLRVVSESKPAESKNENAVYFRPQTEGRRKKKKI